jgi:PPM family protein phosphatase
VRRAFVRSHVGHVRSSNEDRCAVSACKSVVERWQGEIQAEGGWALVADGVGGHVAGEVAAAIAIEVLRPLMPQLRTDDDIQKAVNSADQAIYMAMQMRPDLHGMATTIAGVVLRRDGILAFNAGDSRLYAFHRDRLEQISTDDATRSGALLQCLGGFQEPVPMLVHVRRVQPEAHILICSDGLTDMLPDEQIAGVLRECSPEPAEALVEAALGAGGHDNVSVIVIQA